MKFCMTKMLSKVAACAMMSACSLANLNTVGRATELPTFHSSGSSFDTRKARGKAVHLDIQQRLLVVNALGKYCAEPSPDALGAFAAAASATGSKPELGTIATAISAQGSAASVGLRTQSITLMRDAMYRMCEAYANGEIDGSQVAALLARSQDLSAVILAVEQLTAPVVAQQAALESETSATALASAVELGDQIASLDERISRISKRRDSAEAKLREKDQELQDAADALIEAESNLREIQDRTTSALDDVDSHEADLFAAESNVNARELDRMRAQDAKNTAQSDVDRDQELLTRFNQSYEKLLDRQESALSDATTQTRSSSKFQQASAPHSSLQDRGIIAEAVKEMVLAVVNEDRTIEECTALLTSSKNSGRGSNDQRLKFCLEVIATHQNLKLEQVNAQIKIAQQNVEIQRIRAQAEQKKAEAELANARAAESAAALVAAKAERKKAEEEATREQAKAAAQAARTERADALAAELRLAVEATKSRNDLQRVRLNKCLQEPDTGTFSKEQFNTFFEKLDEKTRTSFAFLKDLPPEGIARYITTSSSLRNALLNQCAGQ